MIYSLLVFILGLSLGSFANALVYRVHAKKTLWGRSMCVHCKHELSAKELIPVVSFLWQRGTCRQCKKTISWHYPAVEFITGMLFLALWCWYCPLVTGNWIHWIRGSLAMFAFVIIFLYDAFYMEIPDVFSLPAIVVIGLLNAVFQVVSPVSLVIGLLAGAGVFLIQYVLSKGRWVGGGDIRVGALLGVLFGFPAVFVSLFIAYILGSCVAIPMLVTKRADLKTAVPFGTFLTVAGVLTLFAGQAIVNWYAMMLGY